MGPDLICGGRGQDGGSDHPGLAPFEPLERSLGFGGDMEAVYPASGLPETQPDSPKPLEAAGRDSLGRTRRRRSPDRLRGARPLAVLPFLPLLGVAVISLRPSRNIRPPRSRAPSPGPGLRGRSSRRGDARSRAPVTPPSHDRRFGRSRRWSRFLGQVVEVDSGTGQEAPRWPGRGDGSPRIPHPDTGKNRLPRLFAGQPICRIVVDVCASAHYWGRMIQELGHEIRLMPPA